MRGPELLEAIRAGKAQPPAGIMTLGLQRTHEWLTSVGEGAVTLSWEVDPAYFNLEGAVICSWTAAIADQALFLAGLTVTGEGETTSMRSFHLQLLHDIVAGRLELEALLDPRVGDELTGVCLLRQEGRVAARVTAWLAVLA